MAITMAMINTKALRKQPLGRTLKERANNRYRSNSSNGGCNSRSSSSSYVKFLVVVAAFCGLVYCFGPAADATSITSISIPEAASAMIAANTDTNEAASSRKIIDSSSSSSGSSGNGDATTAGDETEVSAKTSKKITSDVSDDEDESTLANKPITVVPLSTIHDRPIRIFCYGDSLTAGTTPPTRALFPYAELLKKSLEEMAKEKGKERGTQQPLQMTFEVDHAGFPGWTSQELLDQLKSPVQNDVQNKLMQRDPHKRGSSYYDILIYLAGTNDLGRPDPESNEGVIARNILDVHAWSHHVARIPFTIALPIPGSAYQSRDPNAAKRATKVNDAVRKVIRKNFPHVSTTSAFTMWTPFPVSYNGGGGESWATDGLHLSQMGYQQLGHYLASIIFERMLQ